jgi:hypothetical protein
MNALRADVLRELDASGAKDVNVRFDGYGDEGQVESIEATGENEIEIDLEQPCRLSERMVGIGNRVWDGAAKAYAYPDGYRRMTVHELIEEWVYATLEEKHPGWEIDSGSRGEISIQVSQRIATCELEAKHSEYHEYEV